MKHILLSLNLLILLTFSSTAQDRLPKGSYGEAQHLKEQEYFLEKSNNTKTVAWLLAGSGAALAVTGYLVNHNNNDNSENWSNAFASAIGTTLAIASGVLMVGGSIPLFFESRHYKRKAMRGTSAFLKAEKTPVPLRAGTVTNFFPAVGIKIVL
jgi:hypothetical protein